MRTSTIRRPVTPFALAAALLTALVLLFAWPSSATAHDALVESSPAADSTVETLPSELTLTFSAALITGEGTTAVVVTDADGTIVSIGEPEVNGAVVTQPLEEDASAGAYHVAWQVLSSDGHPTSSEFDFTVATSTISEDTATAAPAESATAAPADDPNMSAEASFSPWWIIAILVVVLIAAFILILLARRRTPPESDSDSPSER